MRGGASPRSKVSWHPRGDAFGPSVPGDGVKGMAFDLTNRVPRSEGPIGVGQDAASG
jgi:hypothetical protein